MATLIISQALKVKVHWLVSLWWPSGPPFLSNLFFLFVSSYQKGFIFLLFVIRWEESYIATAQDPFFCHDCFHGIALITTDLVSCGGVKYPHICNRVQGDGSFLHLLHPVEGHAVVVCVAAGAMLDWCMIGCLLCPMLGAQEF